MTIKIRRPSKPNSDKAIDKLVDFLNDSIDNGVNIDEYMSILTDKEKEVLFKMVIDYEYKTYVECGKYFNRSGGRITQIIEKVYRKFIHMKGIRLQKKFREKVYIGPFVESTELKWSWANDVWAVKETTAEDNLRLTVNSYVFLSSTEAKELAEIANQIYLTLK